MRGDEKTEPFGREFTRTDFLKRSVVAGVGFAGLPAFLAACGGSEQQSAASQSGGAEMPDPLSMGIIPAEDNAEQVREFEPVADYVGEQLGVEVELFTATDYSGIIEAMRSEEVDLAWYGPLSYVLASEVADAEAVAVQITEEGATDPTYKSLMITKADSDIQNIKDLEGGTFSFVDPASTSGNLFPRKAFDEAGMDPAKDLADTIYAGGHDASALAVKNGKVDGGAVANTVLENMLAEGVVKDGEVRVIHESQPIPESPIAVRAGLQGETKDKIQKVFVNMTPEDAGAESLGSEAVGYVEAKDSDYDVIRDLIGTLDLDLEKLGNE